MSKKESDRKKNWLTPGEELIKSEKYKPSTEKPKREDLRARSKRLVDPLDMDDKKKDDSMKISDKDIEAAKRLARKKLAADNGFDIKREGLDNFNFREKGLKTVANTYKHLANAFYHMVKASNLFSRCKSSQVSPDGRLGGKGYVQPIKNIRNSFSETINVMSELIDTFYDEVNSPYWKKQTFEEHPMVKEILSEADKLVDKAEDLEEDKPKQEEGPAQPEPQPEPQHEQNKDEDEEDSEIVFKY